MERPQLFECAPSSSILNPGIRILENLRIPRKKEKKTAMGFRTRSDLLERPCLAPPTTSRTWTLETSGNPGKSAGNPGKPTGNPGNTASGVRTRTIFYATPRGRCDARRGGDELRGRAPGAFARELGGPGGASWNELERVGCVGARESPVGFSLKVDLGLAFFLEELFLCLFMWGCLF